MGVGRGKVSPMWSLLKGFTGSSVLDMKNTLYFLRSGRHISARFGVVCAAANANRHTGHAHRYRQLLY